MSAYLVFGSINTAFILLSLLGVWSQLRTIYERKRELAGATGACHLLSLNQFCMSFLAYFSFFVYGYSIEPFNHFIVWPRLLASLIVAAILLEIWRDRASRASASCLVVALMSLLAGCSGLLIVDSIVDESRVISTALILSVSVMLAQGYAHQILLIVRSGDTGSVDLKMSQYILLMDISTIAFALSMGLADGWPLLVLACVSGTTKVIIMYLFYWVRTSANAQAKRLTAK